MGSGGGKREREKRMNEGWFFESPPLVRPFSLSLFLFAGSDGHCTNWRRGRFAKD